MGDEEGDSAHGNEGFGDFEHLFPNISRRSSQRDIKKMVEMGILRELGAGPTDPGRHYVLGTDPKRLTLGPYPALSLAGARA